MIIKKEVNIKKFPFLELLDFEKAILSLIPENLESYKAMKMWESNRLPINVDNFPIVGKVVDIQLDFPKVILYLNTLGNLKEDNLILSIPLKIF